MRGAVLICVQGAGAFDKDGAVCGAAGRSRVYGEGAFGSSGRTEDRGHGGYGLGCMA